jgi:1-acyl-sn-glycerol-3-phosphate acyltransferase
VGAVAERSIAQALSGAVRGVLVTAFFAVILASANLLQLLTLLIRPFTRRGFLRANTAIARTLLTRLGGLAERLHRLRVVQSGAPIPSGENALVLVNHQSSIDINCVFSFAWRHHRLGELRWFAKAPLARVPGIGWGLRFLDTIFVTRAWEQDQRRIAEVFGRMREAELPFWLLLFPEGARQTPSKLAESRAHEARLGLEPLSALMLPRTRGFVATLSQLRDRTHAVYDLTIAYPGGVPTLWALLCGFVRSVHLHVRRFPIAELPRSEAELEAWLFQRWREKDELLVSFTAQGHFPENEG